MENERKETKDKYKIFADELLKWNKTHKLTNYNKEDILNQINDSLYPLEYIKDAKSAIDVGTGAGFPGLILAAAMPNTKWYLVEPLKKRYSFLNYIKMLLELKNVEIIPERIENSNLEQADLITSRAVMKTRDFLDLIKPYIKNNGTILLYKGSNVLDELNGINAKIINNKNRNYVFIKAQQWEK
ncbi:16S rRNA (guanine(527)-N(7))-methyltransferase RsmG [Lebetimonas natsushimae]|nr:16S rRNA (guanine(527)-N(7))-methyltransferase RsmG [Lebetimonas natsushimae]